MDFITFLQGAAVAGVSIVAGLFVGRMVKAKPPVEAPKKRRRAAKPRPATPRKPELVTKPEHPISA